MSDPQVSVPDDDETDAVKEPEEGIEPTEGEPEGFGASEGEDGDDAVAPDPEPDGFEE